MAAYAKNSLPCQGYLLRNGKRKFFDLARLIKAPLAAEGGQAHRCLFAIEREINGLPWR
jgi:hypothetical protein